MYSYIPKVPATVFRSTLGAIALGVALLALAACGDDPTATPTTAPPAATGPSVADLAGGSPELFAKAFEDALASSTHRPASEFAAASEPRAAGEKLKIGFIYVGSQRDLGYNQAAFEGSQWVAANHPDVELLQVENIPETAEVQRVAEQMIAQGAKVIFATSFGYSGPIKEIAPDHPDVIFLHMGDQESLENYSAFFGNIWQLEYATGIAAGKTTKSNKLGFIAAFPIPQTLLNVNAFHLGARSVNPDVETTFVLTSDWCDPGKQTTAVQTMINAGVDVVTQHQDCTKTIVEAAERADIHVTGYHQDASPAAPNAWLTGAAWNWGPVYSEIVSEIKDGTYKSSVMFVGLDAGWVKLGPFGQAVPADVKQLVLDTVEGLRTGAINPFTGPISDQDGTERIAAGVTPSDPELQGIPYLVEGVKGNIQ